MQILRIKITKIYLFTHRSKTIRREPRRRKPTTLNSGMSEDRLAVPAVLKAPEPSSTIQLTVKIILCDCKGIWNNYDCKYWLLDFFFSSGIMLVHDLTNKKSSQNLYRWSLEALNKDSSPTGVIVSNGYVDLGFGIYFYIYSVFILKFICTDTFLSWNISGCDCICWSLISFSLCRDYDREQFAENPVPLLLIGTKFDQIPENKRSEVLTRTAFLSEDFNAEEINLVSQHLFIPTCSDLKPLSAIKSASSLASLRCFGPALWL